MDPVFALAAAVIGLIVGGVINVLADDLPARTAPRLPHYPDGTPRSPSAWLGITAFLSGQRRSPHADDDSLYEKPADLEIPEGYEWRTPARRLSWRYPLVEIFTALTYGGLALAYPDNKHLPVWFLYVAILYLITVIDIEHRLILFVVVVPSCVVALLVALVAPVTNKPFIDFVAGGAAGFLLFFIMFMGGAVFSAATKNDEIAFGFGDVMLAALSGLMIGWRAFIFASVITVFVGAVGAVLYLIIRAMLRRGYELFTPLPYGPYIVIGTLIMLLFRDDVQHFLQNGF